jgi:hypothetical protein
MQKKIHIRWLFGFIFSIPMITTNASDQQWLRYRSGQNVRQILGNIGSQQIKLSEEKPAKVGLPEFEADNPLFGQWLTPMVESGRIWLALDRSEKDGPYDLLFIDSNGDGHLEDESVVTAYQKERNRSNFGPVKVLFEVENEPVAYHLNFEFSSYNNRNTFSATSGGWYEGQITVGRQTKHCMLIDQNANGTFNDTSDNAYECDRIVVGEKDDLQTSFAGKEIVIGAVIYEPEVVRDGSFIKFAAVENVAYGKIRLPETIHQFAVKSDDRLFTIEPDKGAGQLPVGKYRIQLWKIERKDEQGNAWILTGQDFGSRGNFKVSDGEETKLEIGEPIVCSMQIRKSGSTYSFSQILRGRLGERIEMSRNGSRPEAPKLNIKNADGSYDRSYRFEYG